MGSLHILAHGIHSKTLDDMSISDTVELVHGINVHVDCWQARSLLWWHSAVNVNVCYKMYVLTLPFAVQQKYIVRFTQQEKCNYFFIIIVLFF